jgi:aldehyde:ferredoxin oxidoreductase
LIGIDLGNLTTEQKMAHLRQYREDQYERLLDAVYKRRGWDENSIPTVEKMQALGMDLPEVVAVIEWAKKQI